MADLMIRVSDVDYEALKRAFPNESAEDAAAHLIAQQLKKKEALKRAQETTSTETVA